MPWSDVVVPSGAQSERECELGARNKARKRAVEILYEGDLRGLDPETLLSERVGSTEVPPVSEYTVTLVSGVTAHLRRIDELIVEHAEGWTLERMPTVDRAVLRIGLFELLFSSDVPPIVAIDEAVDMAKGLSTDDSPRFVNGLLDRLAGIRDQLRSSSHTETSEDDATPEEAGRGLEQGVDQS